MTPYHKYRSSIAAGWTRIDMLLAIYRSTIQSLEEGLATLGATDIPAPVAMRTQKLLLLLLDGLNDDIGEPIPSIRRLLLFAVTQVQTKTVSGWSAARKVLQTLQEAFERIADQARTLEQAGQIEPLPTGPRNLEATSA